MSSRLRLAAESSHLDRPHLEFAVALNNLQVLVQRQIVKYLSLARGWPIDFNPHDLGGLAQADQLLERIGAERSTAVDMPIDAAGRACLINVDPNPRSDR